MHEMKDSGIEWIGEIPIDWTISKLKNETILIGSGSTPISGNLEYYENGTINWIQSGDLYNTKYITNTTSKITEKALKETSSLKLYINNFIVLAMYGASVGNVSISCINACSNQACCCIKTNKTNHLNFMYYWLNASRNYFLSNCDGGTQPNISQNKIKNHVYCFPRINQQRKISEFLDEKCSEIDSLISDIKLQISQLEEYKKSIITEAVTKGLDTDVEMKDSGIEWIGMIPKHWNLIRMKDIGNYRNGLTYSPIDMVDENNGTLVLRSSNIQNGKLELNDNVYVNSKIEKKLMVKKGDILICSRNGSRQLIGKNTIISEDIVASFGAFMMIFRCDSPKYINYILNSNLFSYYLGTFITATINQLTGSNFGNMKVVYCKNKDEQNKIVDYLDTRCGQINSIIDLKKQQLSKLEEYKKSMIYEYVTGKKEAI